MPNQIICRTCHEEFDGWDDLANHISTSRDKLHMKDRAGKKWAANFKYKNILYDKKDKDQYRQPTTEEQKLAREDSRRILSGETKLVPVKCPRCKDKNIPRFERLETEHINEPQAAKIDNCYIKLCEGCR